MTRKEPSVDTGTRGPPEPRGPARLWRAVLRFVEPRERALRGLCKAPQAPRSALAAELRSDRGPLAAEAAALRDWLRTAQMEWAITLWDGGPPPDPAGWKPWVTSRVGALQEISEAIATQLVGGRWEQSPDPRRLALERATLLRELRPPRHFGIYATRDARSPAQTRQLERVWRQSAAELARSWTCARWLADEGGSKRLRLRFGDEIDGLQRDLPALLELMRPNLVERPRAPDGPSGRWDAAVRRARAGLGEWKHERPLGSIGAESRDLAAPTDDEDAID